MKLLVRAFRSVANVALVTVGAVGALGVLVGCSSGASSTTTNSTLAAGSGGAGSAAGAGSDQLGSFATSVKAGEKATFKAVYSYTGSGTPGTVTIEQKPPKTVFKSGQGEAIGTGTATYFCSTGSGQATCVGGGTSSFNPLAGIVQLFSPESMVSALQAAQAQLAAKAHGYNVSFSNQTFAGHDAKCVTVSAAGQTGKYCVTKEGILAYSGTGTQNFQLTSYSTSVSDSDFSLPAGATVITVPGVP